MGCVKRKGPKETSTVLQSSFPNEIVLESATLKSPRVCSKIHFESRSDSIDETGCDPLLGIVTVGRRVSDNSLMVDDDSSTNSSPLDGSGKKCLSKAYFRGRTSLDGIRTPSPNTDTFDVHTHDKESSDSIATAQLTPIIDSDTDSGSISTHPDTSSMNTQTFEQDKSDHLSTEPIICLDQDESIMQKTGRTKNVDKSDNAFSMFRIQYLIVHVAIMLADGLQGTHLYVLYEGYGYSVASLYALGFISGALTSPFIGPLVDRIGRKKAAMMYCVLEIGINLMEQYPLFIGLIFSRVIGGITTNLLFSVFESWLLTEHRKQGFAEEKLEVILRDSTIVSNSAAIVSGYIAHSLAASFGPVGPFEGAVTFTWCALLLVAMLWTENYGSESSEVVSVRSHMVGAFQTIIGDSKISRIGLIQGLTEGSLQTFVFLWSPALRSFAHSAPKMALGLDNDGEPAYGLIFGGFMACGVVGGVVEPLMRKLVSSAAADFKRRNIKDNGSATEVGLLCAACYLLSAILLFTPCLVEKDSSYSFSICLGAFMLYEFLVGLYMPCEGVLRSIFMPNKSTCSLMTMLRVIVNVSVALGVISTNYISFTSAFSALSIMMVTAACLQLSLISGLQLPSLR